MPQARPSGSLAIVNVASLMTSITFAMDVICQFWRIAVHFSQRPTCFSFHPFCFFPIPIPVLVSVSSMDEIQQEAPDANHLAG
jgi:hypothetical protein